MTQALAGLPPELARLDTAQWIEILCASDPRYWAEFKRGYKNAAFQNEWYDLVRDLRKAVIVAPREHAKTEIVTVNATAWRSIYRPGTWTYIFANTSDQAETLKARVDAAILDSDPRLVDAALVKHARMSVYANGSMVTVAGAGKSVRGAHPDIIIGDDVLEEEKCLTSHQREKTSRWWLGTVSNMAHPGTTRTLLTGERREFPPTRIYLVGTPFHRSDLLLSMRDNSQYRFYRYTGEFVEGDLVPGTWAVEVA